MSNPRRKDSQRRQLRDVKKKQKRKFHSPCSRPPITPTGLHGDFDRKGGGRYHRIRALLGWAEVHTDVDGFRVSIRSYQIEWQYSTDDVNWFEAERHKVPAKHDDDSNASVHYIIKGSILAKLAYRYRVRAESIDNCKSPWSDWHNMGAPAGDLPPSPVLVKVFNGSLDRVVIDWDAPSESEDNDILDERIAHFAAQIADNPSFSPVYKQDRFVHNTKHTFKVADEDINAIYYGRVRSIGVDHDKSSWINARQFPNSDPFASPEGVVVGTISSGGVAIGSIHWHAGPRLPPHYLRCNGDAFLTVNFALLFAEIGYTFGMGSDGNPSDPNYFRVPDLKNRHVRAVGNRNSLGQSDGLAENDRDNEHDPHSDDSLHGPHDAHSLDATDEAGHVHNASGISTGGPAGIQQVNGQGAQGVGGPNHTHGVFGFTGLQQSPHHHQHAHAGHGDHVKHPQHTKHKGHHFIVLHPIIRAT